MATPSQSQDARLRPLRRAEYEQLVELGAFRDEKLELLYGRLVRTSPQGHEHVYSVRRLAERLIIALQGRAVVQVQMPFAAAGDSEPEPDIAVVPAGDYLEAHPAEAFVIIEVSKTSLADDRDKARLYAASRVHEYWIVNLVDGLVEVHRDPAASGYARVSSHARGEQLRVPGFGDVLLQVNDVLPPRR